MRFAPLGGEAFRALVPEAERGTLPDSLVLRTADGRLRVRSAAVLESLRRIGGPWALAAALGALVPRPLADRAYDGMARLRRRIFSPPADVCPAVPAHLRPRFFP